MRRILLVLLPLLGALPGCELIANFDHLTGPEANDAGGPGLDGSQPGVDAAVLLDAGSEQVDGSLPDVSDAGNPSDDACVPDYPEACQGRGLACGDLDILVCGAQAPAGICGGCSAPLTCQAGQCAGPAADGGGVADVGPSPDAGPVTDAGAPAPDAGGSCGGDPCTGTNCDAQADLCGAWSWCACAETSDVCGPAGSCASGDFCSNSVSGGNRRKLCNRSDDFGNLCECPAGWQCLSTDSCVPWPSTAHGCGPNGVSVTFFDAATNTSLMLACAGGSPGKGFADRASLCVNGWRPCSSARAVAISASGAATNPDPIVGGLFWTDDELAHVVEGTDHHFTNSREAAAGSLGIACLGSSCSSSSGHLLHFAPAGARVKFEERASTHPAGTLCCPPWPADDACAAGADPAEPFSDYVHGCPGSYRWALAAEACPAACHVCSAGEWVERSRDIFNGQRPPAGIYWTSVQLGSSGQSGACFVDVGLPTCEIPVTGGGNVAMPMRVCGGPSDSAGNTCAMTGCSYQVAGDSQHFGGCTGDLTAGVLCCCP